MSASIALRLMTRQLHAICISRAVQAMENGTDAGIWETLSRQIDKAYKILDIHESAWSLEYSDVWIQVQQLDNLLKSSNPNDKQLANVSSALQAAIDQI